MNWEHVSEITIGSIPGIVLILGFLFRLDRKLHDYMVEHEILIRWYCKTHDLELRELPTRSGRVG